MTAARIATVFVAVLLVAALGYAVLNQRATLGTGDLQANPSGSPGSLTVGPQVPDFAGITGWENSAPLTIAGLRGKVVLVDFWTYSCINCQRTLPVLRSWWRTYKDQGLVIVGVHSPEFDFEKDPGNVRRAIKDLDVEWPVALDPNMTTWNAWQNQYWPAEYLIDQQGRLRHEHFGEGEYDVTEAAIRTLLGHPGASSGASAEAAAGGITAEAYAGAARSDGRITLTGPWTMRPELADATGSGAAADIDFTASKVYLVGGPDAGPVSVEVTVDGRPPARSEAGSGVTFDASGRAWVSITAHDLYPLLAYPAVQSHRLRLTAGAGFQLFTFTFG